MLERRDVGHRVVVRRRVGVTAAGRPQLTDVLGQLMDLDEAAVTLHTDDGRALVIPAADVLAAKRVPPRPVRYSAMAELERIADLAWPAPVHERLGSWYLRAAQGWTNRANSALPLGDAGRPLAEAATACRSWYDAHGLQPKITVPLPLRRDVADGLTDLGWRAQPLVLVQTAALPDVLAFVLPDVLPEAAPVHLSGEPSPEFIRVVAARKQSLPPAANHVLTAVPDVRFAEVRVDGTVLAVARGAVVAKVMHLGLVEVDPGARRQGLARLVTRSLAQWAAEIGAERVMLQVEQDNEAAVRLYGRLGFTTHHRYVTYHWPS